MKETGIKVLDIKVLRNMRISFILQFFFLVYILVVMSIFYSQLKKETKTISNTDIDGTGITSFVILGFGILFCLYHIYHSYRSFSL